MPHRELISSAFLKNVMPGCALLLVALGLGTMLTGCVTLDSWLQDPRTKPVMGKPVQAATTWESQVVFLPDILHDGKPTPCLVGRLYLFGHNCPEPILAEGNVMVQLRRPDLMGQDGEPMLIEQWPIPSEQLQQMRGRDMIGWGYSLALPWATYHPGLTNLVMTVSFTPREGYPLYSRSKIKIQNQEKQQISTKSVQMPLEVK